MNTALYIRPALRGTRLDCKNCKSLIAHFKAVFGFNYAGHGWSLGEDSLSKLHQVIVDSPEDAAVVQEIIAQIERHGEVDVWAEWLDVAEEVGA